MRNYIFEHELTTSFAKSWLSIIEKEPYFNPENDDKDGFKDCVIGRFGQFTELGEEVFQDIVSERSELDIFEALLLIGWKVSDRPSGMALQWQIMVNAIANKELDPISPRTSLRFSKDFSPVYMLGSAKATIGTIPDLTWNIPFNELISFAALKWGTEPFSDLIDQAEFEAFKERMTRVHETDSKPPYLDESHPMFSLELSIAVEAWEKVLSSNPSKQKTGSRKKLILNWLKEHHKTLSDAAKERIAVMLNPDGDGGTPPSDGEKFNSD